MKKPDTDGGRCPVSPSNKRRDLLVGSVANYFDIMQEIGKQADLSDLLQLFYLHVIGSADSFKLGGSRTHDG